MTTLRLVGSGRQSAVAEAAWEAEQELAALNREAIVFVEDLRGYLHVMGRELLIHAPDAYRVVRAARKRLDAYEARHRLPDDEPVEGVAA